MDGALQESPTQGMEAMKNTTLVAGLIALASLGVGCKSTPKLPFWKTAKADEATAVAHAPPALPSDAAKLAATTKPAAAQTSGGEAPSFVPGPVTQASSSTTIPASYPSTDAPAFTPDVATRIASAAPASASASAASLGSIAATPYDPTRPPRPSTASTASTVTTTPATSRYGAATTALTGATASTASAAPAYGTPAVGATTAPTSQVAIPGLPSIGGFAPPSRYARDATTMPPAGTTAANTTPTYDAGSALNAAASRYGAPMASTAEAAANAVAAADAAMSGVASATTTTTTVATTTPYRPGGTGTYPSATPTQPPVQVATRPQEPAVTTPNATATTVPNVSRPGEATTPGAAGTTSAGRYW